MKKSQKPCRICHGRSERPCMFCGWKLPTAQNGLTKEEILERDGFREYITFLTKLSLGSLRGGNCSTQSAAVDKEIAEHRQFARDVYIEVRVKGRKPESVGKELGLTKQQILTLVHHELLRMQPHVSSDDHPRPYVPKPAPVPLPPQPKPVPRKATFNNFEVVEDDEV